MKFEFTEDFVALLDWSCSPVYHQFGGKSPERVVDVVILMTERCLGGVYYFVFRCEADGSDGLCFYLRGEKWRLSASLFPLQH